MVCIVPAVWRHLLLPAPLTAHLLRCLPVAGRRRGGGQQAVRPHLPRAEHAGHPHLKRSASRLRRHAPVLQPPAAACRPTSHASRLRLQQPTHPPLVTTDYCLGPPPLLPACPDLLPQTSSFFFPCPSPSARPPPPPPFHDPPPSTMRPRLIFSPQRHAQFSVSPAPCTAGAQFSTSHRPRSVFPPASVFRRGGFPPHASPQAVVCFTSHGALPGPYPPSALMCFALPFLLSIE